MLDSTLRMPLDTEPLNASEIDDVRRWLLSGAKVDDNQQPVSLVEIYGQTKASARAPLFYPKPIPISSLLLSQGGRLLLVGGYSEILIWNIEHQSLDFRLSTRGRMVTDIKWAAGGKLVVASGAPGKFGVLEASCIRSLDLLLWMRQERYDSGESTKLWKTWVSQP